MKNLLENSRTISFYIFFIASLIAVFVYIYPRYEFDLKNSEVTFGFENGYNAEMSFFYSVRNISEIGFAGDRIVFFLDFDSADYSREQIEELITNRKGAKIVFIGNPPDISPAEFATILQENEIEIGFLELNQVTQWLRTAIQHMDEDAKKRLFRVHTLKAAEVDKLGLTYPMVLRRWIRAKHERSIDFFWIKPLEEDFVSYEKYGQDIAKILSPSDTIHTAEPQTTFAFRAMLVIASFSIIFFYSPLFMIISAGIFLFFLFKTGFNDASLYLAGLTGAFGITGIFKYLRDLEYSPFLKLLSMILSAFILGVTINALSFSFDGVNQVYMAHAVKLTLFYLPLLVFLREFLIYGYKDLGSKLHWADLLFLIAVVLFGIYYIIRSGNSGWVLSAERQLRDQLEVIIGIRPRFKEVFGIPALWLYIFGYHKAFGRYAFLVPVAGTIGLCSIVNSFQHVHTPIFTILYRETAGVIIGMIIGIVMGLFFKYVQKKNI